MSALGAIGKMTAAALVLAATAVISNDASAAGRFGLHCAQDFESNWLASLPYTWERCNRFSAKLDELDDKIFYYDLSNKAFYWHDTGDQYSGSLEDVDLFFAATHGGITADGNAAAWGMWNAQSWAWADQMRLGDESVGLGIFATYACETQRISDGKAVDRWYSIFAGGLKYALGSHGTLWSGYTTSEVGEEFAKGLQQQKVLKTAWHDGLTDWYETQDISAFATGANQTDCYSRRDNMKWQNHANYSRLRDSNFGYLCWAQWRE